MPITHHRQLVRVQVVAAIAVAAMAYAAACFGASEAGERVKLEPEAIHADIARAFADAMPALHVDGVALDDSISARALRLLLAGMDPDRSRFLAGDIAQFKAQEKELDDMLKAGDVSFAYSVYDLFKKRMRDRCEYVEKLLDEGFDFSKDEELVWRKEDKDVPWPENKAEQDELWRKKVKNALLRRTIAERLAKEKAAESGDEEVTAGKKARSPAEVIRHQYGQYLTVLEDTEAVGVLQRYLTAFAHAYDPHSDYMSPTVTEDFAINMRLSLGGIGALLSSEDGAAKIVRVIPGGPAEREGSLRAGDKIVAVGQGEKEMVSVLHWPLSKTVSIIRGEKGTTVVLSVIPESDATGSTRKRVVIERDIVKLKDQEAKGEVRSLSLPAGDRKMGIITLPAFYVDMRAKAYQRKDYKSSVRDVDRILGEMSQKSVSGIILDLRSNGGGALDEAIDMTGLFISRGAVVQTRDKYRVISSWDKDPGVSYGGPLVVLVSRMSASASEILAGALQDYGRAVIVGDARTHGKGTVQRIVDLNRVKKEWGSLKVTTSTFYRITGSSTQLKGISSDIVVSSGFDLMDVGEDSLKYALPWSRIRPAPMDGPTGRTSAWRNMFDRLGGAKGDHQRVVDLSPAVAALSKKSQVRRAADPRYVARREMLDRFAAWRKRESIPLNMAEREALAKEEQRLQALQEKAMAWTSPDDGPDGKKKGGSDLVMEEALSILSDLVDFVAAAGR